MKHRMLRQTGYVFMAMAWIFIVVVIVCIATNALASDESVIATMYVKTDVSPYLNGRSSPQLGNNIEAHFQPGEALEVVEYGNAEYGKGWTRVIGGEGGTVWVNNDYITAAAPLSEPKTYVVDARGRVHVRKTPNGDHVRFAGVGEQVTVIGWAGSWAEVKGGFIDGYYLTEVLNDSEDIQQ